MALTFNLETVTNLYKKLERDARALDEKVTSDRLFNFVVTGYSLIDWIKNDPSISAAAKNDTKCLYEDRWLKVCGDLATACKHFKIDQRPPITSNTSSSTGFGMGRYGKGVYGIGEVRGDYHSETIRKEKNKPESITSTMFQENWLEI